MHFNFAKQKVDGRLFSVCVCSVLLIFATPRTVAHQAPLSVVFSRQEYYSGLPFPSPGYLPDSGIKPTSLGSAALAVRFVTTSATWEAQCNTLPSALLALCTSILQNKKLIGDYPDNCLN